MKKKIFLALSTLICLMSPASQTGFAEQQREITVSVATSLKDAFQEIGKLYESKDKTTKILFNFGASGDLATQIEGGAPVDVFASAAVQDMDELDGKGLIIPGSKMNFARNELVLIKPFNSKIEIASFPDLAKPEVTRISIGNIKTVPVGRYAREVLQRYAIFDSLKDKFIFAENVRQVLDYVGRGEVDAGIVYSTDALSRARDVKVVATAPDKSHEPVLYYLGAIKGTKNEKTAREFIKMVVSKQGSTILKKYGFGTHGK